MGGGKNSAEPPIAYERTALIIELSRRLPSFFSFTPCPKPDAQSRKALAQARRGARQLRPCNTRPPLLLSPPKARTELIHHQIACRLSSHDPQEFFWSEFSNRPPLGDVLLYVARRRVWSLLAGEFSQASRVGRPLTARFRGFWASFRLSGRLRSPQHCRTGAAESRSGVKTWRSGEPNRVQALRPDCEARDLPS
jgi:hypothetical protein